MGYDLRNRMFSLVRTGSGNANENMWTTFQFNNLDQIVGSQRGSGSTAGSNLELIQTITRDQIGRPTQIAYTANNPGGTSPLDSYSMQYAEKRCQEPFIDIWGQKKGVRNLLLTFGFNFASLVGYGKSKASGSWWFDLSCA